MSEQIFSEHDFALDTDASNPDALDPDGLDLDDFIVDPEAADTDTAVMMTRQEALDRMFRTEIDELLKDDDANPDSIPSEHLMQITPKQVGKKIAASTLESWDGADQAQLRERLSKLKSAVVYIDMTHVRKLHPGTFGIFCEHAEAGKRVVLVNPRPEMRITAWFKLWLMTS